MNKILKNIIVVVGGVAALAIAYAGVSYATFYGQSIEPSSFRSFSATAEGKSVSIPDIAEFSFQVISEGGKDLTATQAKNTEAVNKAIDFVKNQGVASEDIKTLYYNVNPRYESYSCYNKTVSDSVSSGPAGSESSIAPSIVPSATRVCPPPSIVGYTVTQSVDVKMRDFAKISDIMGGVVTNGANQVGSLSFTTDDPTAVQDDARTKAITKAKVKAEAMAKAGGFRLGRLLGITEGGGVYPMYDRAYGIGGDSLKLESDSVPPTPIIEPGSQETTISVTLRFEIR